MSLSPGGIFSLAKIDISFAVDWGSRETTAPSQRIGPSPHIFPAVLISIGIKQHSLEKKTLIKICVLLKILAGTLGWGVL